ncbi:MAG: excinuclease ABC subunit UvrA [Pirellulaceae bacterium]|nr:excinuclease ABC subunit UvrA [Pirellulaceae bacterium]
MQIRGARAHNLRNIDVDIPRDALTVITGVSGSGKSSLAFDTLYAEGQRQYIDSLSAYARQFLDQIPRPDVDSIDGLAPTLAIDQKPGSTNARSTVATISEIYDYLRLLYARVGTPHCIECGSTISQQSSDVIRDTLAELPDSTKLILLAPMVRGRRGAHRDVLDSIRVAGLIRARVDGEIYALEDVPELAVRQNHTIEAVVDRLVIREGIESRLSESIALTLRLSGGTIATSIQDAQGTWQESTYNTAMACADCGNSFEEIEPRTFSFNSPYGACGNCEGIGYVGDKDSKQVCPQCNGGRLRPEALSVTIHEKAIHELTAMPLSDAVDWLGGVESQLSELHQRVARPICGEVIRRLSFLKRVGVSYLTLDRPADTLSGGELQRVRLATSIGSGLVGVCYVLDEPSIGLHPADHDKLIECIRDLQRQGNTVVVVEHDQATMMAADVLIDIGPGAGKGGGQLIGHGTPKQIAANPKSVTGQYLSGRRRVPIPGERRGESSKWLTIKNVSTHNLKDVTVRFPLGRLIGVSGVSGSGKSSLINDTLYPALARKLGLVAPQPGPFKSITGAKEIDKLIVIDQAPIGRSPRSCPATYAGVLDEVRKVFVATRDAKTRGFKSGRFSFNSPAGRCELCKGHGVERIEMNFLNDLFVTCTRCGGRRFNRQTLQVRFKGANIADVLDMTIDEATEFFENVPKLLRLLKSLQAVGLGYVHLGQSSTTLSGGEAQRIKLGTELARASTGKTLYVLDEPTTGLHFADVERLVGVLQQLVEAGNTVIVIEHNFDLLATCDWLIDLGPTGGIHGGHVLATGTPEQIAQESDNATGRFLQQTLDAAAKK